MSFTGKLLRVERGPDGDGRAWNKPEQTYKRSRLVVEVAGMEQSALTGRQDVIAAAQTMVGQRVTVLRGGKAGIVGGIRLAEQPELPGATKT